MKTSFQHWIPNRALAVALAGALWSTSANAIIVFTIENAGVQQTSVAGALTETFNSVGLGPLVPYPSPNIPGTFVGGAISTANQYGGANGSQFYQAANGA